MTIPEAQAALDKGMGQIAETTSSRRVQSKELSRVDTPSTIRRQESSICQINGLVICVISRTLNWRTSSQSTKDVWCQEVTLWKTILGTTLYLRKGFSDTRCAAVSAYTQVEMKDAPELLHLSEEDCSKMRIGLPRARRQQNWDSRDPVVPLERNLDGQPMAGLQWERKCEKHLIEEGWRKSHQMGVPTPPSKNANSLVSVCWRHQDGKEKRLRRCRRYGKHCSRKSIWKNQRHSLIRYVLDALMEKQKLFSKLISTSTDVKTQKKNPKDITSWSYDMKGHAQQCVERCCELAHKTVDQLQNVSTPCLDDHQIKPKDLEIVGELSEVCSQIVSKCLYFTRLGRPDLLWTVRYLGRSVTKWNRACDLRLARLISYIHHTSNYKQYAHGGNQTIDCKLFFPMTPILQEI